jgi:hypothetical protein
MFFKNLTLSSFTARSENAEARILSSLARHVAVPIAMANPESTAVSI